VCSSFSPSSPLLWPYLEKVTIYNARTAQALLNMNILTRSDDAMLIHSRWEGVACDSNKQINFAVDEAKSNWELSITNITIYYLATFVTARCLRTHARTLSLTDARTHIYIHADV